MLEEKVLEERDPDLEEDTSIFDSREDQCRDVAEGNDDERSKVNALRCEVYMKENKELINRDFWWPLHIQ